jgi:hypothetical protein
MKIFLVIFTALVTSMTPVPDRHVAYHRCIPQKEISCIVETSFVCPPGYIDGCITKDTRKHECVLIEEGPSCEIEMDLKCPKNFHDGCLLGDTDYHLCIPDRGPLCSENIRFRCPSGFDDFCSKGDMI